MYAMAGQYIESCACRLPIPRDISEEFDEAIAAAKQRPVEELLEGMQQILRSWKSKPRHRPIRGLALIYTDEYRLTFKPNC